MRRAQLVATLNGPPTPAKLPSDCWYELRADLTGDLDLAGFRLSPRTHLIYSLRSMAAGGLDQGPPDQRARKLIQAANQFDLVTLEAERDLLPEVLDAIPQQRRIIAWFGPPQSLADLKARLGRLTQTTARYYLLAVEAREVADGLTPLRLLKDSRRKDVIAYATGPAGAWTRPLAPRLGAALVFADFEAGSEHGVSPRKLMDDYGLSELHSLQEIYGIAGHSALGSPSPKFHNRAYRELDMAASFLPFHVTDFERFYRTMLINDPLADLGWPLRGLVVTAPNKEAAARLAEESSWMVRRSGNANLLLRKRTGWRAETTDDHGLLEPLRAFGAAPAGKRAAVLGRGGSGRTAAAALLAEGADVTLVNRSRSSGLRAAGELGVAFEELKNFDPGAFEIVVHATPAGCGGGEPPFDAARLNPRAVLAEYLIAPQSSRLVAAARARGILTIDGQQILQVQARLQFQLLTGQAPKKDSKA